MFRHATYMLLDAARMGPQMAEAKTRNKAHDSLYRGGPEASLSAVAPYIFQFAHPTAFSQWCLKKGWSYSWGIMVKSSWPLSELHKHFRKFLRIRTESGKMLYFRFYDPRVLRIFLPTCDAAQLREFFGDAIDSFIVEDEDPAFAIRFWQENGVLKSDRQSVKEIIDALPELEELEKKDDPLPPETIAYLKEEGMLEAVLMARNETIEDYEPATAPKEPSRTPLVATSPISPAKEEGKPAELKPKTKWNMFD